MALEKEGQVKGNARQSSLADAKQGTEEDKHGVIYGHGLDGRRESPGQDQYGDVDVSRNHPPQKRHPLKRNVGDVECSQGPFVIAFPRGNGLQVIVHASDSGVPDVYGNMVSLGPCNST